MPTKKLDLSWMNPPKPQTEAPKKKGPPPAPKQPEPCCECGDRDAWWGFQDLWFCGLCAPNSLKRPTMENLPL
jgi:hypothetical protein